MSGNFALDFRHMCERLVPARLQFADHKTVGRIGGVVLTEGPIDGKARRFKIALERIAHLVPPLAGFRLCRDGGRNSAGADDGEKRILDGVVDAQAAKGNAARLASPSSRGCNCSVGYRALRPSIGASASDRSGGSG